MRTKKLIVLPIIIMIALATTGIAFSHWVEQLYVHGTVHGGVLELAFADYEDPDCIEKHAYPGENKLRTGEYLGKDNANCSAYLAGYFTEPKTGKSGWSYLIINISGAYPSYRAHTTFIFHNIGTIPIWICNLLLAGWKTMKNGTIVCPLIFVRTNTPPGDIEGEIWEDYDSSGNITAGDKLVINVVIKNTRFPFQLDPCHDDKGEIDLHFKQDAQQCHRYILYLWLYGVQWNKECPGTGIVVTAPNLQAIPA
jgi:hypothetical protein